MLLRLLSGASVLALLSTPALAQDAPSSVGEFSGSVGFVTDYAFRGMTQSDENPALQGSFDYAHESGFYAGIWASTVDFNDNDEASLEMDFSAGYAGEVKGVSYALGGIYYYYPGADSALNYDYYEVMASLGYDFNVASVGASINYSPEYFGDSGDATYINGSVAVPLPYDFTLNGAVGYQWIDKEATFGVSDYADWTIGIGYAWEGFDFSASYVDTDIDKSECSDACDARFILGVSRSF